MAAPNLLNITNVTPRTVSIIPADTARNTLVGAPSTGQAHKVNTIIVSNINNTTAYNCVVEVCLADGTSFRPIANNVTVPAGGNLTILDKSKSVYLLDTSVAGETVSVHAQSQSANELAFTCSFETLS